MYISFVIYFQKVHILRVFSIKIKSKISYINFIYTYLLYEQT